MLSRWYPYRFEIFFCSQISILFGSLFIPADWFENIISPILFQINLLAGILLISKKRKLMWFFTTLIIIASVIFGISLIESGDNRSFGIWRMAIYFLFYLVVSAETIKQVWKSKKISGNIIFGVISGYISLGLIGFFICLTIELVHPNSFHGLVVSETGYGTLTDRLLYFSYITLLTIGYGDISPLTVVAQKASVLIGLMGQFYLVIITATIVGKYINQSDRND